MKVEGGEMRGRRGGAGKERERVAPRGHSCPSCDSQEGVGVWVPRMQYGSRAREASARAKEAARQRKGGHAVQTADSGMGEKMVTMTRRQCEGEGDRGDDLSHVRWRRRAWAGKRGRRAGKVSGVGEAAVIGEGHLARKCEEGVGIADTARSWRQRQGGTGTDGGGRARVREQGAGGAEGGGDGSTGRQTEADGGESLSHVTARRGSTGQTGEGRVPKCQRVREEHGAREGSTEKAGQGEERVKNRARIIDRPLHGRRLTPSLYLTCSTSLPWTAANPRGSASRATCNNRSTISSVPETISMRPDKEVSARIEIVSVWWSGDAALRGKGPNLI
ncbi:hypothetical protein EDB83DRAFT_2317470 [Lactarius deliciosus]|nr:hypothetical protein EDB83DRAFT_2317470 [Lactarius deliciosus]